MATAQVGLRPRGRLRPPHGFVRSSERGLLSTSKANISPIASTCLDLDLRPTAAHCRGGEHVAIEDAVEHGAGHGGSCSKM
jgi:hypothetical protein